MGRRRMAKQRKQQRKRNKKKKRKRKIKKENIIPSPVSTFVLFVSFPLNILSFSF
jgi:hypothetical protein